MYHIVARMRRLASLLALLVSLAAIGDPDQLKVPAPPAAQNGASQNGILTVHYFDVGQGDGALIISPTGKTVLVDAGPPEAGAHVAERVKALTHGKPLDLVVMSHPHRDH